MSNTPLVDNEGMETSHSHVKKGMRERKPKGRHVERRCFSLCEDLRSEERSLGTESKQSRRERQSMLSGKIRAEAQSISDNDIDHEEQRLTRLAR